MKEAYIKRTFSAESEKTIALVNSILGEYRAQGFRLSLRQLYYQLVARDYIPNSQRSYKNLGNLVSNARQAGLVDWDMIEDRNRETVIPPHWTDPADIVRAAAQSFRTDKWIDQDWHIEVMCEKDALSGVLQPVCRELDIAVTANKGYTSSSMMYEIGKRLAYHYGRRHKQVCVLYLGDHDPSGIDMTRDITDRLIMYGRFEPEQVTIERLALNFDQIEMWHPPENPAKETDARFGSYVAKFGASSWELDAVNPTTLAALVREAVLSRRDDDLWEEAVEREADIRAELLKFADNYESGD